MVQHMADRIAMAETPKVQISPAPWDGAVTVTKIEPPTPSNAGGE
jgi:hypothetical protein